ncbi:hypothetical protein D5086_014629 [Populus alba]|uniref:Uncharacterized protein n=1 Tax=Populus alba TaxID=43335 RepID=A0ACC4BY19_POPAL
MSVSSADEEVKELKKALSDKDRELELARSLLAASTQQQQNTGAFPEGSSAKSDDQRTSQSSSNNGHISLRLQK